MDNVPPEPDGPTVRLSLTFRHGQPPQLTVTAPPGGCVSCYQFQPTTRPRQSSLGPVPLCDGCYADFLDVIAASLAHHLSVRYGEDAANAVRAKLADATTPLRGYLLACDFCRYWRDITARAPAHGPMLTYEDLALVVGDRNGRAVEQAWYRHKRKTGHDLHNPQWLRGLHHLLAYAGQP